MCVARSTSDAMCEWLSATAARDVDGSWTIKASSSAWSRTEHQSCSPGDRRIRHSTRPSVVTSGGLVVIRGDCRTPTRGAGEKLDGFLSLPGYRRFSERSARARRSTDEKKITTPTTRSTSGIDTSIDTEAAKPWPGDLAEIAGKNTPRSRSCKRESPWAQAFVSHPAGVFRTRHRRPETEPMRVREQASLRTRQYK